MRVTPLFFIWVILAAGSAGASLPGHCRSSTVHVIERPVGSDSTATFPYRYSVSEGDGSAVATIIFIPGGPGQTSMDAALSIPGEFSVVRTDPRGMGCNEFDGFQPQHLSSQAIAEDVLALIRDLKPKRYFLYGISYGTVVATLVTAQAEREGLTLPQAVVLEGTIGRAFRADEYARGYFERWKDVKSNLDASTRDELTREIPFGLSSKEWAAWLSSILIYGTLPSGVDYASDELSALSSVDRRESLGMRVRRMVLPPTEAKKKIYREIICRELVPDVRDVKFDFDFLSGELVDTDQRLCSGIPFNRPYNSADHKSSVPLFYFSGDRDPVTPRFQVETHFQGQTAPRLWIELADGGHQALAANLADCSDGLWRAIGEVSETKLRTSLKSCANGEKISIRGSLAR
jgi:pimeloyl-ACP methyl ester carboxylesterase